MHIKEWRIGVISLVVIIFVLGLLLSAWGGDAQKEEETSYRKQVEKKLDILDKEIDELKGKGVELKEDAKAEFDKEMVELRKKQKAAKEQLMEIKRTTTTQWEKVKSAMDGAAHDLKNAYDNLVSRFKERKIENER